MILTNCPPKALSQSLILLMLVTSYLGCMVHEALTILKYCSNSAFRRISGVETHHLGPQSHAPRCSPFQL